MFLKIQKLYILRPFNVREVKFWKIDVVSLRNLWNLDGFFIFCQTILRNLLSKLLSSVAISNRFHHSTKFL